MKTATFGSISHGTLRAEDLVPAFLSALDALLEGEEHVKLVRDAYAWLAGCDPDTGEEIPESEEQHAKGDDFVNDLANALDEAAPPYGYFGTHPGDGADFGFWINWDTMCESFDGLRVKDLSEVPDDYAGEVLHVNDHGNASLYAIDGSGPSKGKLREIWAIV